MIILIKKAEIYSNHRFIAKIKIYKQFEDDIITVIPRNRTDFLFFYPDESLSIHFLDEKGTLFIYHIRFHEIKLVRTKFYYLFHIHHIESYFHFQNHSHQKTNFHALLSDFKVKQEVIILDISDTEIKIESPVSFNKGFVEIFYYTGKKKFSFLCDIDEESKNTDKFFYNLFIHKKEVI